MKTSGSIWGKIASVVRATVVGWLIALVLQVVWSALLVANLRLTPAVPWAAPTILVIVWCAWNFLGGKWGPRKSAEARRQYLRARPVSGGVLGWSLVAGALSIASLCGLWIVMTQLVRIPSMTLPQMENAPLWEVAVMLGAASLIGPFMEQAGIWGYSQVMLERAFRVPVAVLIVSVTFAFGHTRRRVRRCGRSWCFTAWPAHPSARSPRSHNRSYPVLPRTSAETWSFSHSFGFTTASAR